MAEQTEEQSFDIVIVGSGGGGLTAALAAHAAGVKRGARGKAARRRRLHRHVGRHALDIRDNPLMPADGIKDSTRTRSTTCKP